jgi:myo-inositol-1(or 4)-monophosphatase
MLSVAVEAAKEAGKFLKLNVGKVKEIHLKVGQATNLVTEIDRQSEQLIIDIIKRHFPHHEFLAEEGGLRQGESSAGGAKKSEYRWIIDPLDGTVNYTHAFPCFAVSIGLEKNGEIILGVVYDPNFDEMFTAEKGRGAFVNGKRLSVSKADVLIRSLLVTGFPYNIKDNPDHAIEHFVNFLKEAQAVRRMGSAAIDLAYIAAGRIDGFWEVTLNPWDVAAGILLIAEAGGKVTDFLGNPYSIYGKPILASNGTIHEEMIRVLKKALGESGSSALV